MEAQPSVGSLHINKLEDLTHNAQTTLQNQFCTPGSKVFEEYRDRLWVMEIILHGRRETWFGESDVLLDWNIQEYVQTWAVLLPDGFLSKGRIHWTDCDEDALVLTGVCAVLPPTGTGQHHYVASTGSSPGRSLWPNGLLGEVMEKQTSALCRKELSSSSSCPKMRWANVGAGSSLYSELFKERPHTDLWGSLEKEFLL